MVRNVAVIGGGVSGLSCAARLSAGGAVVVVFDTGRRNVGGRCSSRQVQQGIIVDHACQCFTTPARFSVFAEQARRWEADGVVRRWENVGTLRDGVFSASKSQHYITLNGMGALPEHMSISLNVRGDTWVSRVERVGNKWVLYNNQNELGRFDHIVIAHNGKCADRLMKTSTADKLHRLLMCQFGDNPSAGTKMQLSSLWTLVVVFREPLKLHFEGAELQGCSRLSWVANNTKKYQQSVEFEAWTLISTRSFGKQHKCPQENIPPQHAQKVTRLMLEAFQDACDLSSEIMESVVSSKLQLWGAAVPMNTLVDQTSFALDTNKQASICGDWCTNSPSLAGAWTSGYELAGAILSGVQSTIPCPSFEPVDSAVVIGELGDNTGAHETYHPAAAEAAEEPPSVSHQKRGKRQRKPRTVGRNETKPAESKPEAPKPTQSISMESPIVQESETESARLRADKLARERMTQHMAAVQSLEEEGVERGAWKWTIRKRIWDLLEATGVAAQPRPVHHRIPNFVTASDAADTLMRTEVFKHARLIKVNPDTPQKTVRAHVLAANKLLLTPQPRLRTGFFSLINPELLPAGNKALRDATTSAGVSKFGQPQGLDSQVKVDLVVVGSVAVSRAGARIGKGEGFAELEYGMLRWMGVVDDNTVVATTVHDEQLVEDNALPVDKLLEHDVPVDLICTPTRTIWTNTKIPKPTGIYWHLLSADKLSQIRVLGELKSRIEKEQGEALPIGIQEVLPPTAQRAHVANRRNGARKKRDACISHTQCPFHEVVLCMRRAPKQLHRRSLKHDVKIQGYLCFTFLT